MFSLLKQREYRWFRWDPAAVLAALRPQNDLPPGAGGRPIDRGETVRLDRWHRVDTRLQTGPFHGYLRTNPIEAQMQWLCEVRPAYLIAQPADLEHLALALQNGQPPDSLCGLLGVAQEVTDEMRGIIERSFRVPLHQNYGLNEIGLVACRCPEAGRFHVHTEHCYLEIVDAAGAPCRPGEQGRVLVTALRNAAMPLVRYDTDDLAEASDGPCPCGRTLPSFGRILGRYRRTIALPPGSRERFSAVQQALRDMPPAVSGSLRQYQLHQYRDRGWELRVVTVAPLPAAFGERLQQRWAGVQAAPPVPLRVTEVQHIPRPPGGKFQDFTSDYMPQPGAGNATGPASG
jgi:phenylacetate-CoA ligase